MSPPDEESRSQILQIELKKMPVSFLLPPYKIRENIIGKNLTEIVEGETVISIGNDFQTKLNDFVFDKVLNKSENQIIMNDLAENMQVQNDLEGYDLLYDLINKTKGFSGAEMVSVVQEAGMLAIDEMCEVLKLSHLYSAISGIQPQITNEMLLFYKNIAKNY